MTNKMIIIFLLKFINNPMIKCFMISFIFCSADKNFNKKNDLTNLNRNECSILQHLIMADDSVISDISKLP